MGFFKKLFCAHTWIKGWETRGHSLMGLVQETKYKCKTCGKESYFVETPISWIGD